MSRPDLLLDPSVDYGLAALDAHETQLEQWRKQDAMSKGLPVSPAKAGGDKVWEGKGMLSWVLQEDGDSGATQVLGKIDDYANCLQVNLQLTEVCL